MREDVLDHIFKMMERHGHRLRAASGGPNTVHAEDFDGVKYLIVKRKNWYEVLIKTNIRLALP